MLSLIHSFIYLFKVVWGPIKECQGNRVESPVVEEAALRYNIVKVIGVLGPPENNYLTGRVAFSLQTMKHSANPRGSYSF